MSLKAADKKVVIAFSEKKAADGKILDTDGKVLNKIHQPRFARWEGDYVVLHKSVPAVKSDEVVIRFMKKHIPKNWWKDKWVWSSTTRASVYRSAATALRKKLGVRADEDEKTASLKAMTDAVTPAKKDIKKIVGSLKEYLKATKPYSDEVLAHSGLFNVKYILRFKLKDAERNEEIAEKLVKFGFEKLRGAFPSGYLKKKYKGGLYSVMVMLDDEDLTFSLDYEAPPRIPRYGWRDLVKDLGDDGIAKVLSKL